MIHLASETVAYKPLEDVFIAHEKGARVAKLLKEAGYTLLGQLCFANPAELLRIDNFGEAALVLSQWILRHNNLPGVGSARSTLPPNVPSDLTKMDARHARAFIHAHFSHIQMAMGEPGSDVVAPKGRSRVTKPSTYIANVAVQNFRDIYKPPASADLSELRKAVTSLVCMAMAAMEQEDAPTTTAELDALEGTPTPAPAGRQPIEDIVTMTTATFQRVSGLSTGLMASSFKRGLREYIYLAHMKLGQSGSNNP